MPKAKSLSALFHEKENNILEVDEDLLKRNLINFKRKIYEKYSRKCHGCNKLTDQRVTVGLRNIHHLTEYKGSCCPECFIYLKFKLGKA